MGSGEVSGERKTTNCSSGVRPAIGGPVRLLSEQAESVCTRKSLHRFSCRTFQEQRSACSVLRFNVGARSLKSRLLVRADPLVDRQTALMRGTTGRVPQCRSCLAAQENALI